MKIERIPLGYTKITCDCGGVGWVLNHTVYKSEVDVVGILMRRADDDVNSYKRNCPGKEFAIRQRLNLANKWGELTKQEVRP